MLPEKLWLVIPYMRPDDIEKEAANWRAVDAWMRNLEAGFPGGQAIYLPGSVNATTSAGGAAGQQFTYSALQDPTSGNPISMPSGMGLSVTLDNATLHVPILEAGIWMVVAQSIPNPAVGANCIQSVRVFNNNGVGEGQNAAPNFVNTTPLSPGLLSAFFIVCSSGPSDYITAQWNVVSAAPTTAISVQTALTIVRLI